MDPLLHTLAVQALSPLIRETTEGGHTRFPGSEAWLGLGVEYTLGCNVCCQRAEAWSHSGKDTKFRARKAKSKPVFQANGKD